MKILLNILCALISLSAFAGNQTWKPGPHKKYVQKFKEYGLFATALGGGFQNKYYGHLQSRLYGELSDAKHKANVYALTGGSCFAIAAGLHGISIVKERMNQHNPFKHTESIISKSSKVIMLSIGSGALAAATWQYYKKVKSQNEYHATIDEQKQFNDWFKKIAQKAFDDK